MSEQLTLDGRDTRIVTYRQRSYEAHSGDQWWAAKCARCNAPLSRYDHTEESAIACATQALDEPGYRHHHDCAAL